MTSAKAPATRNDITASKFRLLHNAIDVGVGTIEEAVQLRICSTNVYINVLISVV